MYHITLYENGRFCTNIGGPLQTLPEAIEQIKILSESLNAEDFPEYFGIKFDRNGTPCALIVTDRWNFPIKEIENEEE